MSYPNFEDKHLAEALFSAEEFIKYSKTNLSNVPKKVILVFQGSLSRYIKRKYRLKLQKEYLPNRGKFYIKNGVGIAVINGIGAPHVTTAIEPLIALGVKEFVIVGTAGGLNNRGIFLCEKAIRDEGTSHHYAAYSKYALPDKKITEEIGKHFNKKGIKFKQAIGWTIDAPYRETKKEIEAYRKEGVCTLEMEASAVFTVCKVRKVKSAAVFVVSDILGEKWDPQFHKKDMKSQLNKTFDAVLDFFEN